MGVTGGRWICKGIGGTGRFPTPSFLYGEPGFPFGWKNDFTLDTVCRLAGVMVDGVCGGFRRKSVRTSELGCGSEMFPNEEPLFRREEALLRRRAPRRQMLASVRIIPRTNPGKKPARTALVGNLLELVSVSGEEGFVVEAAGLLVAGEEVEVKVDDGEMVLDEEVPGARDWSAFMTQFPDELQVYPKGQQAPAQEGRLTVRAVVFRLLSGCSVAFCAVISHTIFLIVWHVCPVGQQSTVVFAARVTQDESAGQQKSEGSPAPVHWLKLESAHVDARSKRAWEARAVAVAARQTGRSMKWVNIRGRRMIQGVRSVVCYPVQHVSGSWS